MKRSSSDSPRQVAGQLHRASLRLLRRLRSVDRESGIGPARLSALSVLVFGGPRTIGQLAEVEQVRPPTMTRIVRGLEEAGLARARTDRDDRRVTVVSATRRGSVAMQRGRERRERALAGLLMDLESGDLATLDAASRIVLRLLERPDG
jgi:DNA-binding MarR family transcriptional regulator